MNKTLLRSVKLKTGVSIPQGTPFEVSLHKFESGKMGLRCISKCGTHNFLTGKFSAFFNPPSIATMGKWMDSGIAKTPTGHKTEPDGHGPDGFPSWLLILGMI